MSTPTLQSEADAPARAGRAGQGSLILFGAVAGALTGAALAYLFGRRTGKQEIRLSATRALKAGMLLLGTARQLAALLDEDEGEA